MDLPEIYGRRRHPTLGLRACVLFGCQESGDFIRTFARAIDDDVLAPPRAGLFFEIQKDRLTIPVEPKY